MFCFKHLLLIGAFTAASCGDLSNTPTEIISNNHSQDASKRYLKMTDRERQNYQKMMDLIPSKETYETEQNIHYGEWPVCPDLNEPATSDEEHPFWPCPEQDQMLVGNKEYTCREQKMRGIRKQSDFQIFNSNADVLWPGALVQSSGLQKGIIDPIRIISRTPGNLVFHMITSSGNKVVFTMGKPSAASAASGISEILSQQSEFTTSAQLNLKVHQIFSKEQLAMKLGINLEASLLPLEMDASFSLEKQKVKNHVLAEFIQIYYTISFDPLDPLMPFFNKDVSSEQIKKHLKEGSIPSYISSINYGRKLYLLFESHASTDELASAVKAGYSFQAAKASVELSHSQKSILEEANIHLVAIGGKAQEMLSAFNQREDTPSHQIDLARILEESAKFGADNPGVPISYAARFISNHQQMSVNLTTEYTKRQCLPTIDGQPAARYLEVELSSVKLERDNSFCEKIFDQKAEIESCLYANVAGELGHPNRNKQIIFCDQRPRKVSSDSTITYGSANHRKFVAISQLPGSRFAISGHVNEFDDKTRANSLLRFHESYLNLPSGEWLNFENSVTVQDALNGCKATLIYKMRWHDDF